MESPVFTVIEVQGVGGKVLLKGDLGLRSHEVAGMTVLRFLDELPGGLAIAALLVPLPKERDEDGEGLFRLAVSDGEGEGRRDDLRLAVCGRLRLLRGDIHLYSSPLFFGGDILDGSGRIEFYVPEVYGYRDRWGLRLVLRTRAFVGVIHTTAIAEPNEGKGKSSLIQIRM